MKTILHLPRSAEVTKITGFTEDGTEVTIKTVCSIEIEHQFFRGQLVVPVLRLTAKGDRGNEAKSVLLVRGNTGQYQVQDLSASQILTFDKSPGELTKFRESASAKGKLPRNKETSGVAP